MNDHGIDFADAALVFSGARLIFKMTGKTTAKRDHHGRPFAKPDDDSGLDSRGDSRHIISMRKANEREQTRFGSDLSKIDAHVIQPDEYEEIPELKDEFFERADLHVGAGLSNEADQRLVTVKCCCRSV